MTLYSELPVYKACYDLLKEIFIFTKDIVSNKIITRELNEVCYEELLTISEGENPITVAWARSMLLMNDDRMVYEEPIRVINGQQARFGQVQKEKDKKNELIVYPNPANLILNVEWECELSSNAKIKIITDKGDIVSTQKLSEGVKGIILNVAELATGSYNVVLHINGSDIISMAVIIIH
jgi:hypothetical protein